MLVSLKLSILVINLYTSASKDFSDRFFFSLFLLPSGRLISSKYLKCVFQCNTVLSFLNYNKKTDSNLIASPYLWINSNV